MTTLYTNGDYTALTLSQLNSYSLIRYSAEHPDMAVDLGMTSSGTLNLSARLGSVSALLDGWTGADNLTMGAGNDTVWGNSGNDTLTGGVGNDVLIGEWDAPDRIGNDVLYGGDGNDDLIGGAGNDALYGGNGNDSFSFGYGLAGADGIYGGTGIDAVSIRRMFTDYSETGVQFSRLVLNLASSVEYLLWDDMGVAINGTTGANLFDFSNVRTLAWIGGEYIDRLDVNLVSGNDTFVGGVGSEHVTTLGAGDRVTLGDGDDTLTVLDGTLAGSVLSGGAGYDTLELGGLYFDPQPDRTLSLSVLNGVVALGFENVVIGHRIQLTGSSGAETRDLTGYGFSMSEYTEKPILLLAGDDVIFGASGAFAADGGAGNDTLRSGAGEDALFGDIGNDSLAGGAGNDGLFGGLGDDTLVGGTGDDRYYIDSLRDVVVETGPDGVDSLASTLRVNRLTVTLENLELLGSGAVRGYGNAAANAITAGYSQGGLLQSYGGNDTLAARLDDAATLIGGPGDDLYRTNSLFVVEMAGEGVDSVETTRSSYVLQDGVENLAMTGPAAFRGVGNDADNILRGGMGKDTLLGGLGNDSLYGGAGNDSLVGGFGDDSYWLDGANDTVVELGTGVDTVYATTNLALGAGLENLVMVGPAPAWPETYNYGSGNALDNSLTGSAWNDKLYAGDGNDSLNGGLGQDSLYGGAGNDILQTDDAADRLEGGAGDDLYIVMAPQGAQGVFLGAWEGSELFGGDAGGHETVRTNLQSVRLSQYIEDVIDLYAGGSSIFGNGSDNRIETGRGKDTLYGQYGNDTLIGGQGDDIYGVFVEGWISTFATIEGFRSGHDRIALFSNNYISLSVAGDLGADLFKDLANGAVDATNRVLYDRATGTLFIDPDGSGAAVARAIAHLSGNPALTAADFTVVVGEWTL